MNLRTAILSSISLLGALGLTGCDQPSTAEGITREQYLAQLPAALCAHSVRCGNIGRSEEASCRSRRPNADPFAPYPGYAYDDAMTAGRVAFDGVAARKCLDYYRALRCHEDGDNTDDFRACRRIYRPRVADGGTCQANNECRSGTCNTSGPGCPGTCAPSQGCNRLNCDEDSFCNNRNTQCTPRRGPGTPCDSPTDHEACQAGLVCIGGVCDVPQQTGGRCATGSGWCAAGLDCDSATGTCRPRLAAESPCQGSDECQDGLVCAIETFPSAGFCKPVLDFPSACDPNLSTAPGICPFHAYCDPNTRRCVERVQPGASCASEPCANVNYYYYCEEATLTCQVPLLPGADCTPPTSNDPSRNPCAYNGRCDPTTRKCVAVCP
jgi:hypothetical protein